VKKVIMISILIVNTTLRTQVCAGSEEEPVLCPKSCSTKKEIALKKQQSSHVSDPQMLCVFSSSRRAAIGKRTGGGCTLDESRLKQNIWLTRSQIAEKVIEK